MVNYCAVQLEIPGNQQAFKAISFCARLWEIVQKVVIAEKNVH